MQNSSLSKVEPKSVDIKRAEQEKLLRGKFMLRQLAIIALLTNGNTAGAFVGEDESVVAEIKVVCQQQIIIIIGKIMADAVRKPNHEYLIKQIEMILNSGFITVPEVDILCQENSVFHDFQSLKKRE